MPHTDIFIVRLRAQMTEQGITQQDLADELGKSLSTAKRICKRGVQRTGVSVFAVAKAVNCSAAYLEGHRDTPERPTYLREDQRLALELFEPLTSTEKRAVLAMMQEIRALREKETC